MTDAKELAARLRERSDWLDGVAEGGDDASIVAILSEAADAFEAQAEENALLRAKAHELDVRYRGADYLLGDAIEKLDALEQAAAPFVAVADIFKEDWSEVESIYLAPARDEDILLAEIYVGAWRALARAAGGGE